MRIAYFIGTLKKEREDGVTRVLLYFVRLAQKSEIESIIITGWVQDKSESPVEVISVPSIVFPLYTDYKLPLPGMAGFEKKLDKFKPDIIHVHSPDTIAWAALKYAKKRHIPIIATHHTEFGKYLAYYHLAFLKKPVWLVLKKLYNQMNFVTTPSPVIAKELISHGINNVQTLEWGVDSNLFNPCFRSEALRKKFLSGEKRNIILYVSRLTWEKDLKTLAQTYKLLKNHRDDFIMVIVGDGPARVKFESMMPQAIFLGYIEGKELSEMYASSDIFLFPSSTETFGNVTAEAMASGLVPVVADAGGSKSLVEQGKTGFLCQPKNAEDFYKKVCLLLDNLKLRNQMRNAGLKFAKNLTWDKTFKKLLQIYNQLNVKK